MKLINKSKRIFSIEAMGGICKVAPNEVVEVEDQKGERLKQLYPFELEELATVKPKVIDEEPNDEPVKKRRTAKMD